MGSASLSAEIVTRLAVGTRLGAVYSPVGVIVPTVALPPGTALTSQCTVLLKIPVPCTVAVNCCVWPIPIRAVRGVTVTPVIGEPSVTVSVTVPAAMTVRVLLVLTGSRVAVTVVAPGGTFARVKRPLASVWVWTGAPCGVATTCTPASGVPVRSVTVPAMVPVASAGGTSSRPRLITG